VNAVASTAASPADHLATRVEEEVSVPADSLLGEAKLRAPATVKRLSPDPDNLLRIERLFE